MVLDEHYHHWKRLSKPERGGGFMPLTRIHAPLGSAFPSSRRFSNFFTPRP
jgi:hypothetical protein